MSQSGAIGMEGKTMKGGIESLVLNLICLALAALFLGLVAWSILFAGDLVHIFTIDTLFFITVCGLLAVVALVSPLLWVKDIVMSKRAAKSDAKAAATPIASRAAAPAVGGAATAAPRAMPAPSKGSAASSREFPPDVEKMLAQMKRSEPKS